MALDRFYRIGNWWVISIRCHWDCDLQCRLGQKYCIKLTSVCIGACRGDAIKILHNDQFVNEIPSGNFGNHTHCFESFELMNDIIELQSTGTNGADISINLINNGVASQLNGFGLDANLNFIEIDGDLARCNQDIESARFLKINNGKILKSQCIGELTS